jgi:hemerythrin-like domain-containing protein
MPDHNRAAGFSTQHRRLLAMCDELETVADSLPNNVDRHKCLALSRALGPLLAEAQELEEGEIFPALLTLKPLQAELGGTLKQLRFDHQLDLFYAEEVQEMLHSYGAGRRSVSPEAAGFMLRGFFEGLRRHIAFEEHLLVPLMQLVDNQGVRPATL